MTKLNSTIFKQETIQSWFSGVGNSINNEVIQPFSDASTVIDIYNETIKNNTLTQENWKGILSLCDDSLASYLEKIKGQQASLSGYNVSLQGNITGFSKVSTAIKEYNTLSSSSAGEQSEFTNAISLTNVKLGNYLTRLNGANASMGGYIISLIGATVKTVILKAATIALNSAITMGASLIISGLVSAISEWIHKTENMISASEDAIEKIKSINDELKNNQKTISDTAKRYAELAQGVNQLTGENISLSNEDYEEFLTLSNQLAEMFPTLTRNYNDNGDAIVQLSGDVDTIVGSLQNLIEAQRDLTNRQIVDELPTVFDGVAAKSDRYESEIEDLEDKKNALLQGLSDFTSEGLSQKVQTGLAEKYFEVASNDVEEYCRLVDDYTKLLEESNLEYSINNFDPIWNGEYDSDGNQILTYKTSIYIDSSDEDVEKAKNTIDGKIQELASQYETDINKLNKEINTTNEKNKANWTSLSSSIFAWLSTDDSFKVMDDTMQATVQNIVNSLDWGSLDFSSWEDAKQYIQENILSLFNTSEGKETLADIEVMFGIQTQFNNGGIKVEQYQQKLQEFLNSIENLPPETKKSILLLFGIQTNEDGTTTSDVDTMVENVKKKLKGTEFDDKVGELSLGDLKIAADLEVGDDTIQSWDELIAKIEEVKNASTNKTDIFSGFSEAQSKAIDDFQSKVSDLSNELEKVSKGELSNNDLVDLLQKFPELEGQTDNLTVAIQNLINNALSELLTNLGDNVPDNLVNTFKNIAEEAKNLTTTVTTIPEALNALQQSDKALEDLKKNIKDSGTITADMVSTLMSKYPQMTSVLNDYLQGLASQEDVINALQSVYETDLKNYKKLCIGKKAYDTDFYNSVLKKLPTWVDELAKSYGIDLQNFKNLAEAKAEVEEELIKASSKAWASYYEHLQNAQDSATSTDDLRDEKLAIKVGEKANAYQNAANEILNALNDVSIELSGVTTPTFDKDSSSKSKDSESKDSKQTIDWISRKLEVLGKRLDVIKNKINDTATTFTARIKQISNATKKIQSEIAIYQKAQNKYEEKANSIGLSESLKKKVQNGDYNIKEYSSDKAKKIEEYKEYYDKVQDCADKVRELRTEEKELNKQGIDHVQKKYSAKNDYLQSLIDLRKAKVGDYATEKDYQYMQKQQEKILSNKKAEYEEVELLFENLVESGEIKKYSEDWFSYKKTLAGIKTEAEDAEEAISDFINESAKAKFKSFDKLLDKLSNTEDKINHIKDLMSGDYFDNDGVITNVGIAVQYSNLSGLQTAKEKAAEYQKALANLKRSDFSPGKKGLEEYNTLLEEYTNGLNEAQSSIKSYRDAILDLVSQGIEAETEAYREYIDVQKEALQSEKELNDYKKSIEEKSNDIAVLQKKINELSKSSDRKDIALRLELQKELAEKEEDLEKTKTDHNTELREKALDDEMEAYEKVQDEKLSALKNNLSAQEKAINDTMSQVKNGYSSICSVMNDLSSVYGASIKDNLLSPTIKGLEELQKSIQKSLNLGNSVIGNVGLGVGIGASFAVSNPNTTVSKSGLLSGVLSGINLSGIKKKNLKGYKSGTISSPKDELVWTQEKGLELITKPSDNAILVPLEAKGKVFNAEATQRLWELSQNNLPFNMYKPVIPDFNKYVPKEQPKQEVNIAMNVTGLTIDELNRNVMRAVENIPSKIRNELR